MVRWVLAGLLGLLDCLHDCWGDKYDHTAGITSSCFVVSLDVFIIRLPIRYKLHAYHHCHDYYGVPPAIQYYYYYSSTRAVPHNGGRRIYGVPRPPSRDGGKDSPRRPRTRDTKHSNRTRRRQGSDPGHGRRHNSSIFFFASLANVARRVH